MITFKKGNLRVPKWNRKVFVVAGGTTAYLWAMAVYSYHASRMTLRSIELRFENEGLVDRLRDQTQRALEAREMVEQALVERLSGARLQADAAAFAHQRRHGLHLQRGFQFRVRVEVIFDGALRGTGYEHETPCARSERLLDGILNQRFIDDGQHFLGASLGRRQKARATSGNRKYGRFNEGAFRHHPLREGPP